jgi:hypothetical protein
VNFDDALINNYTYWNAGVTVAFLEKWSVDLRYVGTDLPSELNSIAGDRFVATLKYSF